MGDEPKAAHLAGRELRGVIPALAGPIAALDQAERMTIYQVEHELRHMASWSPRVPTRPVERLAAWLCEGMLAALG